MPAVTVRFGCEFLSLRQDGDGVTARVQTSDGGSRRFAPPIWSAATAARARCARSSASSCPAKAICWRCARRCSVATNCSTACRSAMAARPRPPLSCRRRQGDVPDHAGFDQALDAAFRRRQRRGDESGVRKDRRRSGQIRDAVLRAVAAESAARRPLRQGPRLSRRRCGASGHSDRRARHEFRRRRRHRSVVEARRDARRLGRAGSAQILRGRAPPDRRAQCRRVALCHHRPAQMALDVAAEHPRGFAGRRRDAQESHAPSPTSSSARATR